MTIRNVPRALTTGLLTVGVAAVASLVAHAQDVGTMPKGHVTLVGCFTKMADPHDTDDMRWVLANPKPGPATSVPDPNCTASASDEILRLTDVHERHLDTVMPGIWVEINGELERTRSGGRLREFEVKSFRQVPVERVVTTIVRVPEPAPQARAIPPPEPVAAAPDEPAPVATSGIDKLPHTASPLPLIAILGLFALIGGFGLGLFDRRASALR